MQKNGAVIIPSYQPDRRLMEYLEALLLEGIETIVIVNDGSAPVCQPIFDEMANRCIVLTHDVNKGKGRALKTAYRYLREEYPDLSFVVTADADGQHAARDIVTLFDCMEEHTEGFVLGVRDFDLPHVPLRNAVANKFTSRVFQVLFGKYLRDTQTGLRGFYATDFPWLETIKGERFEYEMNVLTVAVKNNVPISEIPVQTIYAEERHESHFKAWKDSIRIAKQLAIGFIDPSKLVETAMPETEKGW